MQIHGVQIDRVKGRFTGTIDEVDDDVFRHDRFVVMLVTARTAAGATDTLDDGEVVQTMRLKVQDMVPLQGKLRDQAVAFMAHGEGQGVISFGNYVAQPEIKGQESMPVADYAAQPDPETGADPVTGEIPAPPKEEEPEYFDVPVAAPDPVTPRPSDAEVPEYSAPTAEPISASGDSAPPPAGARRVGSVYGHQRKDKALDEFLNS